MQFVFIVFFLNDTATTQIYTYLHTLSLHDALPICSVLNTLRIPALTSMLARKERNPPAPGTELERQRSDRSWRICRGTRPPLPCAAMTGALLASSGSATK